VLWAAGDVGRPGGRAAMIEAGSCCDVVGGRLAPQLLNDELTWRWRFPLGRDALPVFGDRLAYAVGANVAVRREVFDAIGGWEEAFGYGGEDVALSWRAAPAGARRCLRHAGAGGSPPP